MATNVNSPFGFKPVRMLSGVNVAQPVLCFVPSSDGTALFSGDVVQLIAGVQDSKSLGVPCVIAGTASSVNFGVVVGVDPILTGGTPNLYIDYRPASTAAYLYVQPLVAGLVLQVQIAGASAYADIGKNAPVNVGSGGNTVNGLSGMMLGTPATTNTDAFLILGCATISGNVMGENYAIYEVTPNVSQFTGSATGV